MKRTLQFALLVVAAGAASPAFAQDAARAMARAGFKIVSAPAGTRVMTQAEAQQAGVISTGATAQTLLEGGFPVPGLGFDYPHLAAVNRNLETRALIDPLTQLRLAQARQIRRETPAVPFAAGFFPVSPVIVVQAAPPVIVLQQTAPESDDAPAMRAQRVGSAPREISAETAAETARPVEPFRELEEYVLVRKDGGEIFVVAYSQQKGRVVYVTREGLRRSVALEELDGAATTRRNEDRGADVKLPE
jgi:hypothetical protein